MTVTDAMHLLTEWVRREVCEESLLKAPKDISDDDYDYELVHPGAFLMFEPVIDPLDLMSNFQPEHPAILVQLVEGTDSPIDKETRLHIRLHLMVWNPGTHAQDVFYPMPNGRYRRGEGYSFICSMDGMEDGFNLLDLCLQKLKQTVDLDDRLHVMQDEGINFGHYQSTTDGVLSFYPWYLMWVEFYISIPQNATRHNTMDGLL